MEPMMDTRERWTFDTIPLIVAVSWMVSGVATLLSGDWINGCAFLVGALYILSLRRVIRLTLGDRDALMMRTLRAMNR